MDGAKRAASTVVDHGLYKMRKMVYNELDFARKKSMAISIWIALWAAITQMQWF
jgi:hypothetical protein